MAGCQECHHLVDEFLVCEGVGGNGYGKDVDSSLWYCSVLRDLVPLLVSFRVK